MSWSPKINVAFMGAEKFVESYITLHYLFIFIHCVTVLSTADIYVQRTD